MGFLAFPFLARSVDPEGTFGVAPYASQPETGFGPSLPVEPPFRNVPDGARVAARFPDRLALLAKGGGTLTVQPKEGRRDLFGQRSPPYKGFLLHRTLYPV
jgi:hypothetical protein